MSASYVVIGAGLAGAATAWRLAQRGCEVTLVERSRPANPDGSSHGSARILRHAYPDPFHAGLVGRAAEQWDELEDASGERLVRRVGALDHGPERDPRRLAGVLAEVGVAHELVGAAEARQRWPGLRFEGEAMWHPSAGVLDAEASVLAMTRLAEAAGATVLRDRPVAQVRREPTGYLVETAAADPLAADRVVVAAGGWLPDLVDRLPDPARLRALLPAFAVTQESAFHFPYRDDADAGHWPTSIHQDAGMTVYALPGGRDAERDGRAGHKVAELHGGRSIGSAVHADGVVDPAQRQRLTAYVERWLPGLEPAPYAETTCLFTTTPTEDFVIDEVDGLTVVSACSGHGAKFAPLLGTLAADRAMRHDEPVPGAWARLAFPGR
ncbi:sarcosine oxidase [Nocardioides scoriae]|uniref:Sarcosine oxidase n=1 Tax=Nocardioides scoriae TaxID=642780 RepID=A0A1H1V4B9_9ACTN|nr:FAD-dependent oxidoreductase [Nocardioides scoriae]SDS79543.1 sarcosine oxidase [Nocardioides scoriae]